MPGRLAAAFLCVAALIASVDVSAAEKQYAVKGMVVSVDVPAKTFVVSHERIAGLMEAMTMPFEVRQATELHDIVPGAVRRGARKPPQINFVSGQRQRETAVVGMLVQHHGAPGRRMQR